MSNLTLYAIERPLYSNYLLKLIVTYPGCEYLPYNVVCSYIPYYHLFIKKSIFLLHSLYLDLAFMYLCKLHTKTELSSGKDKNHRMKASRGMI